MERIENQKSTMEAFEKLKQLGKDTPIETSSAQYILQQYTTASRGQKLHNSIRNAYAMGKVKMIAFEFEIAIKTCGMLNLQLRVARFMLVAMASLSGGTHPSWEHILKRALLGHCVEFFRAFIQGLLLTWNARSEGPTEIVRHVLFDYFNQKTGLLVHMEGSHFTRLEKMAVAITNLIVQY
ncbi:hypothetical protein CK203_079862 [Vitis vinifera]|uniref:Uncharacterized protein n=1 Tax=Vitis vinifera TaxID=29760 RepID=A0A438DHV7_VITVI|nr:hypothetical protein CK203_079862 [Vitis vinifera]